MGSRNVQHIQQEGVGQFHFAALEGRYRMPAQTDDMEQTQKIAQTIQSIQDLEKLEPDWNDEGASAIDRDCIRRAESLFRQTACRPISTDSQWQAPTIFPSIDGGVQLYWNTNGRQTLLEILPDEPFIFFQAKRLGEPSINGSMTDEEAVELALRAMRDI